MHIGLEESRPIDKGTEKRNSDFPRGPLSAKSLGCTGKSCKAADKKPLAAAYSSSKDPKLLLAI